jgi:hypothetical protein
MTYLVRFLNIAWVGLFSIWLYKDIQDHKTIEIIFDSIVILANGICALGYKGLDEPLITINVNKIENKEW